MTWWPRRVGRGAAASAPPAPRPAPAAGAADGSTAALLLEEVRRSTDSQERAGAAIDQVAAVVVGFAGVIVAVLVERGGWGAVSAAFLGGLGAALALRAMVLRPSSTLDPTALVDGYAQRPRDVADAAVLATSALLYEERALVLDAKRRWFYASVVAVLAAIAALLVSVTVDVVTS